MATSHEDFARQCSPFLDGLIRRHPDWLAELRDQGRLEGPAGPSQEELESLIGAEGLDPGLRQFRNREMLRITWREINRLASLEATMLDLSALAEICLQAAISHHEPALRDQFGLPQDASGQPQ
ncbi:MAG TPA: hypothetical protein VK830_03650, partial [Xanthomonadales bacterium]|nr:hypothetical protein [Xanthomonadales bacterium]